MNSYPPVAPIDFFSVMNKFEYTKSNATAIIVLKLIKIV